MDQHRIHELRALPYDAYLKTEEWAQRRQRKLEAVGYRCECCDATDVPLQVHHRRYTNLGDEPDDDLVALCRDCHERYHDSLEQQRQVLGRADRLQIAPEAYFSKAHFAYTDDRRQLVRMEVKDVSIRDGAANFLTAPKRRRYLLPIDHADQVAHHSFITVVRDAALISEDGEVVFEAAIAALSPNRTNVAPGIIYFGTSPERRTTPRRLPG